MFGWDLEVYTIPSPAGPGGLIPFLKVIVILFLTCGVNRKCLPVECPDIGFQCLPVNTLLM